MKFNYSIDARNSSITKSWTVKIRNKVSIRQEIDQTPNLPDLLPDNSLFNSDNIYVKLILFSINQTNRYKYNENFYISLCQNFCVSNLMSFNFFVLSIIKFLDRITQQRIGWKMTVRIEGWWDTQRLDQNPSKNGIWSAWSSHLATGTRMAEPSNKRNNRIIDFGQMIGRSTIIIHYYP